MNLDTLLEAIDKLSPEEREQVRTHLAAQDQSEREKVDQIMIELNAAIDEFWGDSSEEEMQMIVDAMRTKSKPSEKGL